MIECKMDYLLKTTGEKKYLNVKDTFQIWGYLEEGYAIYCVEDNGVLMR